MNPHCYAPHPRPLPEVCCSHRHLAPSSFTPRPPVPASLPPHIHVPSVTAFQPRPGQGLPPPVHHLMPDALPCHNSPRPGSYAPMHPLHFPYHHALPSPTHGANAPLALAPEISSANSIHSHDGQSRDMFLPVSSHAINVSCFRSRQQHCRVYCHFVFARNFFGDERQSPVNYYLNALLDNYQRLYI